MQTEITVVTESGKPRRAAWRERAPHGACLAKFDPFQNGEHHTMPAWYVGRTLAFMLGASW